MLDTRTAPLRMAPDLRVRPWAGARLAPAERHIGEAWLAGPWSAVSGGPFDGRTLDDLAAELGADLVGSRGLVHGRGGFPVLVKLIDAAEWLSVQVHPDDAQALELEGAPGIGKAEAWLVLDAAPGAELLLGPNEGVGPDEILDALGTAGLPELLQRVEVTSGDCIDVPAGTLHAIGPGVFVYEIQQPCDITYRVWDWGRTDRTIHVEQSRRVTHPRAGGAAIQVGLEVDGATVASSSFFMVRQVVLSARGVDGMTDGRTPQIVTLVDGVADLVTAHGVDRLEPFDTLVLPAAMGPYRLDTAGSARALIATVP